MTADSYGNTFEGYLVRLRVVEPEDWETFHPWNAGTEAARGLTLAHVNHVERPGGMTA